MELVEIGVQHAGMSGLSGDQNTSLHLDPRWSMATSGYVWICKMPTNKVAARTLSSAPLQPVVAQAALRVPKHPEGRAIGCLLSQNPLHKCHFSEIVSFLGFHLGC
jgi:hypothetical protein